MYIWGELRCGVGDVADKVAHVGMQQRAEVIERHEGTGIRSTDNTYTFVLCVLARLCLTLPLSPKVDVKVYICIMMPRVARKAQLT